jgi:hypothetical protein
VSITVRRSIFGILGATIMITDPSSLVSNPFAALTAIAGPAILTNACSVLALGTSNRLGRVVDRTRIIVREMALLPSDDRGRPALANQLDHLDVRAQMLLQALRGFYAALGLFATAAFLSAIGSVLAYYGNQDALQVIAVLALGSGTAAVASLVRGCVQMVRETRLAVKSLEEEAGGRRHSS